VEHWVECVKQISPRDLRLIERLVSAQNRLQPAVNTGGLGGVPDKPQIIARTPNLHTTIPSVAPFTTEALC